MSATISKNTKVIAACYTKEHILAAIEKAFGQGDQASFTLTVDGHESIIVREAMRRYCAQPSTAEVILSSITPAGYAFEDRISAGPSTAGDGPVVCRVVFFRRVAPPMEYEYVAEAEPRKAKIGDWIRWGQGWREVTIETETREMASGPRLCYRRAEVKR